MRISATPGSGPRALRATCCELHSQILREEGAICQRWGEQAGSRDTIKNQRSVLLELPVVVSGRAVLVAQMHTPHGQVHEQAPLNRHAAHLFQKLHLLLPELHLAIYRIRVVHEDAGGRGEARLEGDCDATVLLGCARWCSAAGGI